LKKEYFFIGLFFLFNLLNASIDSDLDGVEDSLDLCPNSKITDIVDKNGCATEHLEVDFNSNIDLTLGYTIKEYKDYSSKFTNLSFVYSFKEYSFNLYLTNDSEDDIESSLSYTLNRDSLIYTFTFGLYIPTSNDKIDYFTRLNLVYLTNCCNLFLNLEYDFLRDLDTKNSYIVSFGVGKNLSSNIYSSINFRYLSAISKDSSNEKYISFTLSYDINSNWYISSGLDIGLNSSSAKRVVNFNIGYSF